MCQIFGLRHGQYPLVSVFAGKKCCFCAVWHYEIRHFAHLSHIANRILRNTVVQDSVIAHDRIDKYKRTLVFLLLTELSHKPGLFLRYKKSGCYGVKCKSKLTPHSHAVLHISGRLQNIKLSVIKRVGHQCRRQVVHLEFHIGHNRDHRRKCNLSITSHIVYKQYIIHSLFLFLIN